jgi:TonB family protein
MGDSPRHRPHGAYAQPGEIDTALVEAESLQPRPAAKPNLNRRTPTSLSSMPESRPTASRPVAEWERKSLGSAHAAESRPSPLRPNQPTNPFYKGLAPAGNVEPSRKGLAPAPGLVEGKPAAFRLGTDPGLSHGNPALQRGLAPPPGIASTPSVPQRLEIVAIGVRSAAGLDIQTLIFERKHIPPPSPRPELKPVSENPEPLKTPTLSPPRSPQVKQGVSARFELLPDAKPRWNQVGMSAAGQLVILGLALLSPMIFPQTMKTALRFDVIELMQPVTEIPVAPRPPLKPKPKPKVEPEVPELKLEVPEPPPLVLPQLSPRQPHVFLNLKPLVPKAHIVEEKPLELKQNLKQPEIVLSSNGPKAPKEEVKPNPGADNPAPDTVNAALSKVQTGGFGDPNGIAGPGNPNRRGNINHAGSPGLPGGPGYGNGTGGAQGLRGTVASDGSGRSAEALWAAPPTIRYKPNPAYSAEGRERKIQGDVVLEVIFLASGQIKVTRVVSGLGFGMDDEAIHAAQRIRFTPATLDGKPVDFSARIRIEFRLVRVENPSELPR